MQLPQATIQDAFRMHGDVYAATKGWGIPYHIECWVRSKTAFDENSPADFKWLYFQLKNHWHVFRGAIGAPWEPKRIFDHLRSQNERLRNLRLSEMNDDDLADCWQIIESISDIKPMKYAPSVVAISKFLHFWNPRLFVIVDHAIIWSWVFAHRWLKRQIEETRARIESLLPDARCSDAAPACDLLSYLAVLSWSAHVVKGNPTIASAFTEHVRAHATDVPIELPIETYEAAAIEWLLLGLVELPPSGVALTSVEGKPKHGL
ncbi:MAG: hypothetical protein IH830_03450 [Planctomycetes bacterium]|nr:hypothetical protein [Planctomycetota bacterium]